MHSLWKSQKKSHSTLRAKRAIFIFWVDKSSLKMPKIDKFWSLNKTKIGGYCQNWKIQLRHFGSFSNTVGCERSPEFSFVAFYLMKTTSEFDFRGKRQNMYLGFLLFKCSFLCSSFWLIYAKKQLASLSSCALVRETKEEFLHRRRRKEEREHNSKMPE